MKKLLAVILSGLLLVGGTGVAQTAVAQSDAAPAPNAEAEAASNKLYLVPGVYTEGGIKHEYTVDAGAQKLSEEQCAEIMTDNAYLCTLGEGEALPKPTGNRMDKNGNKYSFNGWWAIVDATVTYFDKVPALSETTFLYADWRADLSQRKDPVAPEEGEAVMPEHYMTIKRAKTGKEEIITLRVSGTDIPDADKLGYDRPVQLFNFWFDMIRGDDITVFWAGL